MASLRVGILLVALAGLASLAAVAAEKCECDGPFDLDNELLRGPDQVKQCEDGYYCRCSLGLKIKCVTWWGESWRLDEDGQRCVAATAFDCEYFFNPTTRPPRTTPVTGGSTPSTPVTGGSTPSTPVTGGSTPSTPVTGGSTPSTPVTGGSTPSTPVTGGSTPSTPVTGGSTPSTPVTGGSTPSTPVTSTPSTPSTPKPTPGPTPKPECVCDTSIAGAKQLVRTGDKEADQKSCEDGYYCVCATEKRGRCDKTTWMFSSFYERLNEKKGECEDRGITGWGVKCEEIFK